jgi:transcriptional regulator with XRE-family HTH domain
MRHKQSSNHERDAVVERLREFLRFNYMTGAQVAQRIGVRPETLYPWLQGKGRPKDVERILAFLNSVPADRRGITPTGYEYREYKNWRGVPKPRRCPFCKSAKGEIRRRRVCITVLVRIAERSDRGARAMMKRYWLGTVRRELIHRSSL